MSLTDKEPGLPDEKEAASRDETRKSNIRAQVELGGKLETALSFLRSTARTNDYFTGYSLNEIIQERIELIGPTDDESSTTVGETNRLTLIATLNELLIDLVGEGPDHKGGNIQKAIDLPEILEAAEGIEYIDD